VRYNDQLKALLTPAERKVFAKLNTPQKIQAYLDKLPINFEVAGEEGIYSPREVLKKKKAQCMEGALFAAAALAYHGREPLIMDFRTVPKDEDHVIAPFKQNGLWGAISKTNHSVLRWRDPIYKSSRELAASYFHEYYLWTGKKSLVDYSGPVSIKKFALTKWLTTDQDLDWMATWLNTVNHYPVGPKKALGKRRAAYPIELKALAIEEFKNPEKRSARRG
jgi:hypothetical protein